MTARPPLRIAWVGPTPTHGGGATFVGTQLLLELARRGVEVDCFIAGEPGDIAATLREVDGLNFLYAPKVWSWDRWYSRTPLLAFISGHLARAKSQLGLATLLARRHAERPYDLVYQFSQSEYGPLRRLRHKLPPIVVHPSTHAAGELRWVLREAALAKRTEPPMRRLAVRAILTARTLMQRYELPRADRVLGVSGRFSELLHADYGIDRSRLGVVPNPVDLAQFHPAAPATEPDRPLRLVFVSRVSARKGVQFVTQLSHRLSDLEGQVQIHIFGGPTLWSNYLPLLDDLNPRIAAFHGQVSAEHLASIYCASDLLLQPALYEPFGLTVAEALASGLPVVASCEVGAIDGVDPRVCRVFSAGDMNSFEASVREMIDAMRGSGRTALQQLARAEAERLFAPKVIGDQLVAELCAAIGRDRSREAPQRPEPAEEHVQVLID